MFLFKSKEDKEKKKQEKKLQKELKNQSNINLSNVKQSSTGDDESTSSTSSTLQNSSKMTSSIVSKFELSPTLNAPPRPKKGILKGMSKFASVSSIQSHKSTSSSIVLPITSNDDSSSTTSQAASLLLLSTKNLSKKNSNASSIGSTLNLNILPDVKLIKYNEELRVFEFSKEDLNKFKLNQHENVIQIEGNEFFLPGDVLVEINDKKITDINDAKLIFQQGEQETFKLKIRISPEMYEFIVRNGIHKITNEQSNINLSTLKRIGSFKFKKSNQNSNTQNECDDVWINHPDGGYSIGKIIQKLSSPDDTHDRYKIKLEANGSIIEINEDLIEKCCSLVNTEDLTNLSYINETSILNNIRQRYFNSLIHTYMGNTSLLIIKPKVKLQNLYNDKIIKMFKGCKQEDMPPHIYAYTQSVYRNMLSNRQSHSIVLHGHSQSGKTTNSKHILDYLFKITTKDTSFPNKINSLFYLIELFCDNRYLNTFTIDFNHTGHIIAMNMQLIAMDYLKLLSQSTYSVFYSLLLGSDDKIKSDYQLNDINFESNMFIKSLNTKIERHSWSKTQNALRTLNFTQNEIKSIEILLSVIYHLGLTQPNENTYHFNNQNEALKVSNLLGITFEQLNESIFPQFSSSTTENAPSSSDCVASFAIGLYQECLNLLTLCINRSFKLLNQTSTCSLTIIDPPGFQTKANSYADLLMNYLTERLQLLYYQMNFINPIEKCTQEGLDIDLYEHIPDSPSGMVNIFDKPPNLVQRTNDQPGLMWLLDESDESTLDQLKIKINDISNQNKVLSLKNCSLLVNHQFNQFQIEYDLNTLLVNLIIVNRNISSLFSLSKKECLNEAFSGIIGTGNNSLKRNTSFSNRKFLNNSISTKNRFKIFNYFKIQLDSLLDSLKKTKINFVFCLLPSISNENINNLDCALIRRQLRSYQLVASCRIYRQSYPDFVVYNEFKRRYSILYQNTTENQNDDDKNTCLEILKEFNLNNQIKFGYNKLFLKAGILNKLENERDDRINDIIIKLQSYCRRYLTQETFQKKKIQTMAIKCIQRNIRNYFQIKEWKWWKLYSNLKPLINVSETSKTELENELNELKFKYDKLQHENNDLKTSNLQLENKLMNLKTEYIEEHAANAGTLDLLEVETSERMRLERELNELRPLYNEALNKVEQLETELLEYRLNSSHKDYELINSNNGDHDHEDGLKDLNIVDNKLKRDLEYLKKQLKIEKENSYELKEQNKKFIESKLKEFNMISQDLEKQLQSYKRKNQKNLEDLQDLQRILDETKLRNAELERIQSKYDSELYTLKNELDNEVNLRDKYKREKDQLQYDLFKMKTDLDTCKLELDYQKEKNSRLEKDLKESINETTVSQDDSTQSSIRLKSTIRDLEFKLKDQEDELEEQSAAIQQLEQVKLRLEMQLEKDRQKFHRELTEKENEMDELRFNTQKKIKAIEIQLEDESELNSNLQREKRELERKLRELEHPLYSSNNSNHLNGSKDEIKKLQRLVLKYKTLAHDSNIQLEKLREQIPKQNLLKTLKNQLEDSEMSRIQALKAKQLMQNEIDDMQKQIEELVTAKKYLEEQNIHLQHDINNLKTEIDDQERELNDLHKKYQHNIQTNTLDSSRFIDLENKIDLLQIENQILKDKLRECETKINYYEQSYCDKSILAKYENKIKEYEIKFDLEQTQKTRLHSQVDRLKQANEKIQAQFESLSNKEKKSEDEFKKANKHNKEALEELCDVKKRLIELEETRKRLENENEILEKELSSNKSELKIALSRLESFQTAFNSINEDNSDAEFDSETDDDDDLNTDSDDDEEYTYNESTLTMKHSALLKADLDLTISTINSARSSRRDTNTSNC